MTHSQCLALGKPVAARPEACFLYSRAHLRQNLALPDLSNPKYFDGVAGLQVDVVNQNVGQSRPRMRIWRSPHPASQCKAGWEGAWSRWLVGSGRLREFQGVTQAR